MKNFDEGQDFYNRPANKWVESYSLENDPNEINYYTYLQWYDFDFYWSIIQFFGRIIPQKKWIYRSHQFHPAVGVIYTQICFSFN